MAGERVNRESGNETHLTLVDEGSSVRRQIDDRLHLDLPHRLVNVLHVLRDAFVFPSSSSHFDVVHFGAFLLQF